MKSVSKLYKTDKSEFSMQSSVNNLVLNEQKMVLKKANA